MPQSILPSARYLRPVPFLSPHGAEIESVWVFPIPYIKITVVCQTCTYATSIYCGQSMKSSTRRMAHSARRSWTHWFCICFCMFGQQNLKTPNLQLKMPLQRVVYEVWDLPCISVLAAQ